MRYLAPLRARGSDEPAAVCIALPYIHEYRLGIRTTDSDAETTRRAYVDCFRRVYRELADVAEQRFPNLPLVATGHLTMGKVESGDAIQEIHQVGFIDSLPAELLDPRLRYVALGHIHRAFPVEPDRIWYSGSPIPISLVEMHRRRQVLLVELQTSGSVSARHHENAQETGKDSSVRVQQVDVPLARELLEYCGNEAEVLAWIRGLTFTTALPPMLYLRVNVQEPQPQLSARVREALEQHPAGNRPLLVELREVLRDCADQQSEFESVSLEELSPRQVFGHLCSQMQITPSNELLQAFDFVATAKREELDRCIARVQERTERDPAPSAPGASAQLSTDEAHR